MSGADVSQPALFITKTVEDFVPKAHPLRAIRKLLDESLMTSLFKSVLKIAQRHRLLSTEHFSVDGTLIDAWASRKSFKPKDDKNGKDDDGGSGGKERDFRHERRSNQTHESSTDPDAELMRKGAGMEARLRYGVHHLVENRHHLIVDAKVEPAASVHEREVALTMLKQAAKDRPITAGGDKGFDTANSSDTAATMPSRPMWRRTPLARVARPSMRAPRGIRAMRSASANVR